MAADAPAAADLTRGDGGAVSDGRLTLGRAELRALVEELRGAIAAQGLEGARLCLPLDASLGSLALLAAGLESGADVALIPAPADGAEPDAPAFADAVVRLADASEGAAGLSVERRAGAGGAASDRVYLRTSGTTGTPKWAVHATSALVANAAAVVDRMRLSAEDRVMLPVPIHHMYGLGAGLLPSLLAGAEIRIVPRGNPLEVFAAQRAFQPTAMFLVPSQCRSIMALGRSAGRVGRVVVAGDKLAPDEAARFEETHGGLIHLYGSTELGAITAGAPDDPAEMRHATAGAPMGGVEMALDDAPPEDVEGVSAEDMAEVRVMRVRHANGLSGYAGPDGEIDRPAGEAWTTGDLVRLREGGRVEVLGRSDHAVNRDGLLVHLGEIEGCLARARGVDQAVVVAAGESRRGRGLVAYVTLARPDAATQDDIMEHARGGLPPRAVPDRLVVRKDLPMLPSGKPNRIQLTAEAVADAAG